MKIYIKVESTSLHAVTIGPDATAGSMRKRAKKNGDNVPISVAIKQAPHNPQLTITPNAAADTPEGWTSERFSK